MSETEKKKLPKVIKLSDPKSTPEGYIQLKWKSLMHKGIYAVQPKASCMMCTGQGIVSVSSGKGLFKDVICDCVSRRIKLFFKSQTIENSPKKGKPQRLTDFPELIREINRLEQIVHRLYSALGSSIKERDTDLTDFDDQFNDISCEIQDREDSRSNEFALVPEIEKEIEDIWKDAQRRVDEKQDQIQAILDSVDASEQGIKSLITAQEILSCRKSDRQDYWKKQIDKLGGAKYRRSVKRLEELQNRLSSRLSLAEAK